MPLVSYKTNLCHFMPATLYCIFLFIYKKCNADHSCPFCNQVSELFSLQDCWRGGIWRELTNYKNHICRFTTTCAGQCSGKNLYFVDGSNKNFVLFQLNETKYFSLRAVREQHRQGEREPLKTARGEVLFRPSHSDGDFAGFEKLHDSQVRRRTFLYI